MTIRGMAKTCNKEKHYFQGFEAGSDSFVQVTDIFTRIIAQFMQRHNTKKDTLFIILYIKNCLLILSKKTVLIF